MDLGKDLMLDMYRSMQRIRQFEGRVRDLAIANELPDISLNATDGTTATTTADLAKTLRGLIDDILKMEPQALATVKRLVLSAAPWAAPESWRRAAFRRALPRSGSPR